MLGFDTDLSCPGSYAPLKADLVRGHEERGNDQEQGSRDGDRKARSPVIRHGERDHIRSARSRLADTVEPSATRATTVLRPSGAPVARVRTASAHTFPMCGICGNTQDPRGDATRRMNDLMTHRGPDDEGVYVDPATGVALGARRLSILDVAGGHQPLANEDGTVWAVLNGEIYNYPALRDRLLARGHNLATRTDTEVLVHLYEDFGNELVHAIEGMFAFAVWDLREQKLLLARDRFGEKPLFFSERGGQLVFASELTALAEGTQLGGELDPLAIDAYFVLGYVPGPGTILRGASQLPPGHRLLWNKATADSVVESYWRPRGNPVGEDSSIDKECLLELERLFDASVESRLLSDVPLGVFLSGGIDSMLVAAFAARHSREPIKTFTVDYDVGTVGEASATRKVVARLGSEHHEMVLTGADVGAQAPPLFAGLDQPVADQALVAMHAVSTFARPEVTVALGGEGADELFGGYPRYRWLARSQRMQTALPDSATRFLSRALASVPGRTATQRLATVASPKPMIDRHLDWVTSGRREERWALYGSQLRPVLSNGALGSHAALRAALGAHSGAAELMQLDLRYWLPDDVLVKADRATMRSSLEMRTPYLNRELAEFASSIPASTHLGGKGKQLLRQLVRRCGLFEPERPKRAFRVPAAEWLRGPLMPALEEQIARGALYEEQWFDRHAVARAASEHRSGTNDRSSVLWPLLVLGLWLDRFRSLDEG